MSSSFKVQYTELIKEISHLSPDNYYDFVFQFDEEHYQTRVKMAGITGGQHVLDAGAGYGQWSVALAAYNKKVTGIDVNPNMVKISRILARRYALSNVDFMQGALPKLEFDDNSFDFIWCWGVLMFVDRAATLKEFYRVLKPGGRLVAGCVNSPGRWLYKIISSVSLERINTSLINVSLKTLFRGSSPHSAPNYTTFSSAHLLCEQAGLKLISADYDGHIDVEGAGRKLPMFPTHYLGFPNNIEFIAEKTEKI